MIDKYCIVKNEYVGNINNQEINSFNVIEANLNIDQILKIQKAIKRAIKIDEDDSEDFHNGDIEFGYKSAFAFLRIYKDSYIIPMIKIEDFKI